MGKYGREAAADFFGTFFLGNPGREAAGENFRCIFQQNKEKHIKNELILGFFWTYFWEISAAKRPPTFFWTFFWEISRSEISDFFLGFSPNLKKNTECDAAGKDITLF